MMLAMRTTVTLDPDVAELVKRLMAEQSLSFKEAVNKAIRSALAPPPAEFRTPSYAMGPPRVPLDRALEVAAELENAEIRRELGVGR